ncbi:cell wall-binding repeat-containing protein [Clostridium magnum]|uniref:N-acetylmuramoyl-L-alanine amidase LytC n=1 Tax=Clostridium magnum DSM 2767 TaxID=1121326 RepID=A0A162SYC6_9CLOT|nr:cell wall-binding repeat-containing protein [Clostridium magnum]KZL92029.1 N-acetylmuramoyl-L-alanine amidase LytC precursor [Clostridium magnum DSM 2767]
MKKSIKKLLVTCLTFSLILTQMFFTREAKAEEAKGTVKTAGSLRLGGSDRYKTSVAISQRGWSSSQYVVLASGIEFPDALCAGPLAKKYDAPILLTQPDKLNLDTLKEIKRLGAKNIIIIGGIGSISKNIEDELKSEGITSTERISGADRYETSVKVAEKIGTTDSIALACGLNFPDALSFSPIATAKGIPIVLTNKDSLPDCVKQYLTGKKIIQSYIVGGTGVISDSVKNSVSNPLRLGGLNRYETNVEILKAFDKDLNYNNVYISDGDGPNGNEFADALSGSVLAARTSSPIILAYKSLPDSTKDYIKTKFILGSKTIALGGEASVSSSILNDMSALINEIPASAVDNKTQTTTASQGSGGSISSNITLSVTGVSGKVILSSTAIEMQSGDTAYSVLIRKLGSKVSTKGSGYVRGIDGLKELDYGPLSGWMYSVNGKFPNVSADLYTLKNGDVVAWCYTKNMGQDIGAPMTGGSTGSGGGQEVDQEQTLLIIQMEIL